MKRAYFCNEVRFSTPKRRFDVRRRGVFLLIVAAVASFASLGCAGWKKERDGRLFFPIRRDRVEESADSLSGAETILTVEGRVERLHISADSKRILVERRGFSAPTPNERSVFYSGSNNENDPVDFPNESRLVDADSTDAKNGGAPDQSAALTDFDRPFFELWNVEYGDPRPEPFGKEANVESATFDADGDRVFWTARERGDGPDAPKTTIFATRALEPLFGKSTPDASAPQRLKTAPETRRAEETRLSPGARWLICRERDEKTGADAHFLVLRSDRRRVVRFPDVVKLTFDSSTSNETIKGRVVETLAVSDAGDLVATLVAENPPPPETAPSVASTTIFSPRYKIAIWDLSVAEKVDWEKARKPLKPLEVAQIPTPAPVSSHFCKFSPNGRVFAARLEPRFISLWQSGDGGRFAELGEHKNDVDDFAFSPDGMKIAAGCGGAQARVVVWELRKGAPLRILNDAERVSAIDAVAFAPNGKDLYFANNFGEIKRWETRPANAR